MTTRSGSGLFDPSPVCGDLSWDIAPMINNVEYGERRQQIDGGSPETLARDRALLDGFWDTYPRVSDQVLLSAQLVQAVLQARHREAADDAVSTSVTWRSRESTCTI